MKHTLEPAGLLQGRYKIHELLGYGGMGAVYLAQDTRLDLLCAVKEAFYTTPEALAQFEREAQLLAKLKHPPAGDHVGLPVARCARLLARPPTTRHPPRHQ